jgi:predicted O-methyltransferase YrrM
MLGLVYVKFIGAKWMYKWIGMFVARIAKVVRHPKLILCLIKRNVLVGGVRHDDECIHLVRAWSSGSLHRVDLRELFPGIDTCLMVSIRKPESRIIGASIDLQELVHIASVVKHLSVKRILEIGTFDGFTALNLAANLEGDGEVCTLDLPEDNQELHKIIHFITNPEHVGRQFLGEAEEKRIRQLRANSKTADWASFGAPFDMIFIDGCHTYPFVKSDSANAIRHLRPGGVIFWHDYGFIPDVSLAVDELAREYPIFAIRGTRMACYRSPAPQA